MNQFTSRITRITHVSWDNDETWSKGIESEKLIMADLSIPMIGSIVNGLELNEWLSPLPPRSHRRRTAASHSQRSTNESAKSTVSELTVTDHFLTNFFVGTPQSYHDRHIDPQLLVSKDDTVSDHVTKCKSAKDVDKDRSHVRILQYDLERSLHCLTRRFAACFEEVSTLAPKVHDRVDSVHRQAGAVD